MKNISDPGQSETPKVFSKNSPGPTSTKSWAGEFTATRGTETTATTHYGSPILEAPMEGDGHNDRDWAKQLLTIEPKAVCHAKQMLHHAQEAEDAVWRVMGRIMARGPFTPEVSLEHYFMRAVTNECRDRLGNLTRHLETSLTADDGSAIDVADPHPDALTALLEQESRERIVQAIGKLSPLYQELLDLRFVEELGYKEIGARVGLSTSTVFHHLDKALAQLARILKKGGVHV